MRIRPWPTALVLGLALLLAACAGRSTTTSSSAPPAPAADAQAPTPPPAADATAAPHVPVAAAAPVDTARPAPPPETTTALPAEPVPFAPLETLTDVHFAPSGIEVVRADVPVLDMVAAWLKEHPASLLRIEGYTDDLGPRALNVRLGERRAMAVMEALVTRGIEPDRITTTSYGPDGAVCPDKTPGCRARNRRARFLVKER